ncbi:hypothetical protein Tco_1250654 [Tanacetum coccineum]
MSSSIVTYTSISSDYEEPTDAGSPRVVVYGYDGLPMHPVPGPEEPEQAPLSPDYPLPDDASPTPLSPGYVANSDSEKDPKEDPEEDPADYPANGEDDANDESSNDDDDDDDDDDEEQEASEDDDEEEEEHLAPTDSFDVPVTPILFPSEAEVARFLALPTPPSPLSPLSSPLPQIPSPPLPLLSPPTTSPTYAEVPLGYRVAGIRYDVYLRWTSASESEHVSLYLLGVSEMRRFNSSAGCRASGKDALAHRVDYGFVDTLDASIRAAGSRAMTALGVVNNKVTDLVTT